MGHIKEPDGVDFIINSRKLTKEEESAISNYILAYKAKHSSVQAQIKRAVKVTQKKVEV